MYWYRSGACRRVSYWNSTPHNIVKFTFLRVVLCELGLMVPTECRLVDILCLHTVLASKTLWVIWEHKRIPMLKLISHRNSLTALFWSDVWIEMLKKVWRHLSVNRVCPVPPCDPSRAPIGRPGQSERRTFRQNPWSDLNTRCIKCLKDLSNFVRTVEYPNTTKGWPFSEYSKLLTLLRVVLL